MSQVRSSGNIAGPTSLKSGGSPSCQSGCIIVNQEYLFILSLPCLESHTAKIDPDCGTIVLRIISATFPAHKFCVCPITNHFTSPHNRVAADVALSHSCRSVPYVVVAVSAFAVRFVYRQAVKHNEGRVSIRQPPINFVPMRSQSRFRMPAKMCKVVFNHFASLSKYVVCSHRLQAFP